MILQYVYKPVLNFIYEKITFRIPERVRIISIFMCFLMVFSVQFLAQYVFFYQGLNRGVRDYIICLLMGLIILASVDRRLEILRWRKTVYIPYVIAGLMILAATLDHNLGPAYQAFPLVMLVAFMCLFYVWGNRRDYTKLFECAAKAYILFIGVIFIICVIYYPYYSNSLSEYVYVYAPFGINPNGVAKIFLPGAASGLFMLTLRSSKKIRFLYGAAAGISLAVVVLADSRAGFICTALLMAAYVLFLVFNSRDAAGTEGLKKYLVNSVIILAVITVACGVGIFVIKNVSPQINSALISQPKTTQDKVAEKNETIDAGEREAVIAERISYADAAIAESELLTNLNHFTAGRISIWTVYFQNMTWQGSDELMFYDTEYAHNQYIELSYKAGIMTGIMYLIFNLAAGALIMISFFRRGKRKQYVYFQVFAYLVFIVISMLDTGILPFERGFIFLYYISLAPLFTLEAKEHLKKE